MPFNISSVESDIFNSKVNVATNQTFKHYVSLFRDIKNTTFNRDRSAGCDALTSSCRRCLVRNLNSFYTYNAIALNWFCESVSIIVKVKYDFCVSTFVVGIGIFNASSRIANSETYAVGNVAEQSNNCRLGIINQCMLYSSTICLKICIRLNVTYKRVHSVAHIIEVKNGIRAVVVFDLD